MVRLVVVGINFSLLHPIGAAAGPGTELGEPMQTSAGPSTLRSGLAFLQVDDQRFRVSPGAV